MKRFLLAFLLVAPVTFAQQGSRNSFPGLVSIMTPAEFHNAGLDQLSSEQLATIDAAIARHYTGAVESAADRKARQITAQKVEQLAQQKAEVITAQQVDQLAQQKAQQIAAQQVQAMNQQRAQQVEKLAEKRAQEIAQQKMAEDKKKGFLSGFGLPDLGLNQDWRDQPSLKGKVVGWVGGNSFKLDNGQVWEGQEPIPFELVNRNIEIAPRPAHGFALIVEGKNTTVRIRRIK